MLTRPDGWRTAPGRLLLTVLLLMLCLSGGLAWQAWDAARSQRRVTEAALRDYARFAMWELGRRMESNTNMTLNAALIPALMSRGAPAGATRPPLAARGEAAPPGFVMRVMSGDTAVPDLAAFAQGVQSALRVCECELAVSDYFVIEHELQDVKVLEPQLGDEFRQWLNAGFVEHARTAGAREPETGRSVPRRPHGHRMALRGGRDRVLMVETPIAWDSLHVVVYAAVERGERRYSYGFVLDAAAFARAMVEEALSGPPLLPPSLTGPVRNDDVLSVAIWRAGRDTIFRTAGVVTTGGEVVDTLHLAMGVLTAGIAVRPQLAGQLVIGGLPRSRLPILAGSVGLTLALVIIALFQLHRQQELFRLRSDFVSGVSHELRTPLAQIRLFSELLGSERLDEGERRRSLRILTDEARRLTYLVENVLRFSGAGRQTNRIAPAQVDVRQYLRDIVNDFELLASVREARIVLKDGENSAEDGTGYELHWALDPDAMRQVLLNLLDNAVKYGPHGQTVRVSECQESDRLRIQVDDEGPGVPVSEREHIWEPYRRLSRETEKATGGSGIGLAVARELVELHGGDTFVTDAPGGGSRFVVLLPRIETGDESAAENNVATKDDVAGRGT